jgi:hypothetical protein
MTDADEITVTSSIDNTDLSPQNIYYTWHIQKKDSSAESGWSDITNLKNNFDLSAQSSGLGVTSFSFKPKKAFLKSILDDIVNLKVTATISRTADPTSYETDILGRTTPRSGFASVEIPVNKKGIAIKLYRVGIEGGKAAKGTEICNKSPYKIYCPVIQSQMLVAEVYGSGYTPANSEFSWSLNGSLLYQPLDYSVFDSWSGTTGTTVFFPITENVQEQESISVTATPKDKLQPVTVTRFVTVVEPSVYILSNDESISWPKQYAVSSNSTKNETEIITNYSTYEASPDSIASYTVNSIPDYLLDDNSSISLDWSVNGTSIQEPGFNEDYLDLKITEISSDNKNLSFATSIDEGTSYSLGINFKKYWSADEKDILYTAWGVSPNMLESDASIDVETTDYVLESDEEAMASPKQILAAIGTHLPYYTMYILRLTLTLLVMFFVSIFFYNLTQKISLYEEK